MRRSPERHKSWDGETHYCCKSFETELPPRLVQNIVQSWLWHWYTFYNWVLQTHSRILLLFNVSQLAQRVSLLSDGDDVRRPGTPLPDQFWITLRVTHISHNRHDEILFIVSARDNHHHPIILITTLGFLQLSPGSLLQQVPLISTKNTESTPGAVCLQEELQ